MSEQDARILSLRKQIMVEVKALINLEDVHLAQAKNYLTAMIWLKSYW